MNKLSLLYIYKYENVCVFVCLWFRVFLGHLESDWDTLWHKCDLMPRNGSKTIKFQKKLFSAELLLFFVLNMLKYGIIAKPLYVRIYNSGFSFFVAMCKLCKFFRFLSFKITELLPFL